MRKCSNWKDGSADNATFPDQSAPN
ncbi:unnamed protein product [Cyprideis torosa]|uniref:Uncharacterized protein n=1 Tax=Cyprideis torosa TaxID=163714 RepID=A0A7R8WVV6_9CRUS|nr:unnamed protein product [Cyprideis torosa]CAG0909978.1 unnamed protein product [Cyprideis torosa]